MFRRDFLHSFSAGAGLLVGALPGFAGRVTNSDADNNIAHRNFAKANAKALFWSDLAFGSAETLSSIRTAWELSGNVATTGERTVLHKNLESAKNIVGHSKNMVREWETNPPASRPLEEIAEALLWVGRYREAKELFSTALDNIPTEKIAHHENLFLGLVHTYYCMGDFIEGLALLDGRRGDLELYGPTWEISKYRIFLLCRIPRGAEAMAEARRFVQRAGPLFRSDAIESSLGEIDIDINILYLEAMGDVSV